MKEIQKLTESVLYEAKSIDIKSYDRSKKVYDDAFKKALPTWEKKANVKSYTPCGPSEALKFFKKRIDLKMNIVKLKNLKKLKLVSGLY